MPSRFFFLLISRSQCPSFSTESESRKKKLIMIASMAAPPWKLYQNPHFSSSDSANLFPPFESTESLLRSELELERTLRRDSESLTRSLSLELAEERRLRAEAESEALRCREAAEEAEEERRMLKYADAWREERVQMKLAEAAIVLEEKMRQIGCKGRENLQIKKGVKAAGRVRSPGSGRQKECDQKSQIRVLFGRRSAVNLGVVADARSLVVR